jgi:hypothetical protein
VFLKVFFGLFLCCSAVIFAAPSDKDEASKKEYVDIILPKSKIGDSIVGIFPQLGQLAEECKAKKLKLRVWAVPPLDGVLGKNPPDHVEIKTLALTSSVISSGNDVASLLQAIDIANTAKTSREVIIPAQSFIFIGENFKMTESPQSGFRKMLQSISPGLESLFNLSYFIRENDHSLNVYDSANKNFVAGLKTGERETYENAENVARHRAQVAAWSVVKDAEKIVLEKKRDLFKHPEKPLIFINFSGARPDSDLISSGMSVRILEALAHANPDANFLLADYSKTPL